MSKDITQPIYTISIRKWDVNITFNMRRKNWGLVVSSASSAFVYHNRVRPFSLIGEPEDDAI
jgi:hypothetical protein